MQYFHEYLQLLEQRIRNLEDRALLAEQELRSLKETLQAVKPVHIDNVNYKVQELVVSDLSGTLSIGLTALADPKQIEQWLAKQNTEEQDHDVNLENVQSVNKGEA